MDTPLPIIPWLTGMVNGSKMSYHPSSFGAGELHQVIKLVKNFAKIVPVLKHIEVVYNSVPVKTHVNNSL